jgi:hypothetical protein
MNQIQFTVRVGVASVLAEASPKENCIRSQKSNSYSIAASVGIAALRQSRRFANEVGNRHTLRLGHRSHLEHGHCRSP